MTTEKSREDRLMLILEKTPLTTDELSKRIRLPRTTVGYCLRQLERRGKVERFKRKGKKAACWIPRYGSVFGKRSVRLFEGPQFYKGFTMLHSLPKKSQVYNLVGKDAVTTTFKNVPVLFLEAHQKVLKRKALVIKALVDADAHGKTMQVVNETYLETTAGRSLGVRFVEKQDMLQSAAEYIISREWILLVNARLRRIVLIKDPDMAHMLFYLVQRLYELSDTAFVKSRAYDINQAIRDELARRNRLSESEH